ncbi:hypothetical protein ACTMTF_15315 [Nonomuraea sp. ZG12]|uniref:hypothetical protein n=1 Tax=Nonomuraea sp. ZG12 TaxID=3452207 RepID=UPI003F8AC128
MELCPTCHQETLPAEPPDGSVLLDRDGDAWQRRDGSWDCADHGFSGYTWSELLGVTNNNYTVIHTPDD